MDIFVDLFFAMGCNSVFFDYWSSDFDIIGMLPLEVAILILRKLDGASLLNAAQVSSKWLRIIKFDGVLRRTVREELAKLRQEKLKRHTFLSDSCNDVVHLDAFYPQAKKQRRSFPKSVKRIDAISRKRVWGSSKPATSLQKLR